jgi:hypothetical protein
MTSLQTMQHASFCAIYQHPFLGHCKKEVIYFQVEKQFNERKIAQAVFPFPGFGADSG